MKEKSANATVEAIREEPNHSARIEEKQNHSLLMEKEQKNQQWLQKLSTLVLPEADGVLPEDEKRKKIYLWCSKAAGFEKRAVLEHGVHGGECAASSCRGNEQLGWSDQPAASHRDAAADRRRA